MCEYGPKEVLHKWVDACLSNRAISSESVHVSVKVGVRVTVEKS